MSSITLSLCMIVKDEEDVLARALDSVCAATDEIIIVDTGSTDKTKETAARYTDKIYDFEWCDDFSAARNYSFSKATCEYAMWMDADDVVNEENLKKLIAIKEKLKEKPVDALFCSYDVSFDAKGNTTYHFYRERILRLAAGVQWLGCVHECIVPSGTIDFADFHIQHRRSPKERGRRNLEIYQKNISKGMVLDARNKFYYGRELYNNRLYDEAAAVLEAMISMKEGWCINKIEACKVLSDCYLRLNDRDRALETLFRSFRFGPPRSAVLCKIGSFFKADEKWEEAAFWYSNALNSKDYSHFGDFDAPETRAMTPLLDLTLCYYKLGDTEKSLKCHKTAREIDPDHPSVVYNENFFKSKGLL